MKVFLIFALLTVVFTGLCITSSGTALNLKDCGTITLADDLSAEPTSTDAEKARCFQEEYSNCRPTKLTVVVTSGNLNSETSITVNGLESDKCRVTITSTTPSRRFTASCLYPESIYKQEYKVGASPISQYCTIV